MFGGLGLGKVFGLILLGTLSQYYFAHSITQCEPFGTVTAAYILAIPHMIVCTWRAADYVLILCWFMQAEAVTLTVAQAFNIAKQQELHEQEQQSQHATHLPEVCSAYTKLAIYVHFNWLTKSLLWTYCTRKIVK